MMINTFRGKYAFLSNFYHHAMMWDGHIVPTLEHAYQASKTDVPEEIEAICSASTPGKAKRLGQVCTIRPLWESWKVPVMRSLLDRKFSLQGELWQDLDNTGDAWLEEGNTWGDIFWGTVNGVGQNQLGHLLMSVRGFNRLFR